MSRSPRYLILADGLFGPETSKTANGEQVKTIELGGSKDTLEFGGE